MSHEEPALERLFHQATLQPPPRQESWVESQSQVSAEIRSEVLALLRADRALGPPAPAAAAPRERAGPYELLRELGRGASGTVHLGRRVDPPFRTVAVKITGSREPEILVRFRGEANALARLEHPGIAGILEFDELPDGRAWFAMRLVPGLPIVRFADGRSLDTVDRVRLVAEACAAVAHAHRRGILHRDLKPTNILVDEVANPPRPVIIDLGLAKAFEGEPLSEAERTLLGHVVGTPEYMAPEQALGKAPDVRMDVFSLGCVLAATLTGEPPRKREALRETDLPLFAAIAKVPPALPSRSERARADREVSGPRWRDLDAIVLKAIRIDPDDRYGSVAELEADLGRWLAGEIPDAARAHPVRRSVAWVRRNRGWAAVSALVAVGAVAAGGAVVAAAAEAAREREDADALLSVVESMLVAADPWYVRGTRDPVVEQGVTQSEALLRERGWGESPRVALLRARCLMVASDDEGSIEAARKAIELNAGRDAALAAEAMIVEAYARDHTRFDQPKAYRLADEAVALARTALAADERRMLEIELARGRVVTRRDPNDAAASLAALRDRARAAIGPDDPLTLRIEQAHARAIGFMGDPARCVPLHEELLDRARRTLGRAHPATISVAGGLLNSLAYAEEWSKAIAIFNEFAPLLEESVGPNASMRLGMMNTAGFALACAGRHDEAIEVLKECTRRYRELHDPIHPMATLAERNLVWALQVSGRLDEAIARLEEQCALPVDERQPTRVEIDRQNLAAIRKMLAASRGGG
jgi:tetratricopeptide (TPR) repeat protein